MGEHFAPLFVSLGAAEADLPTQRTTIDGPWPGLSQRTLQSG